MWRIQHCKSKIIFAVKIECVCFVYIFMRIHVTIKIRYSKNGIHSEDAAASWTFINLNIVVTKILFLPHIIVVGIFPSLNKFFPLSLLISSLLVAYTHGKHDSNIHVHWIFKRKIRNPNGKRIFIPYGFEHVCWIVYGLFSVLIKIINYCCLKLLLCKLFWVQMFSTNFLNLQPFME